jgi:Adenylate and Guanylate cyclase catalytic domain
MPETEERKLAAIMFTDMVGYSALSQRNGKLAVELLEEHREILRGIFPRFHGTEIKTIGDAFLVEFQSALEAAQCALEIQRTLAKRNPDVIRAWHRIKNLSAHNLLLLRTCSAEGLSCTRLVVHGTSEKPFTEMAAQYHWSIPPECISTQSGQRLLCGGPVMLCERTDKPIICGLAN